MFTILTPLMDMPDRANGMRRFATRREELKSFNRIRGKFGGFKKKYRDIGRFIGRF